MSRVLVAYASKHGSTEEVARAVGSTIRRTGHHVDVRNAKTAHDVERYDAVVVGGSMYMGRWHADARRFLRKHDDELSQEHLAVFAMGPLKPEEDQVAGVRRQLDRALARIDVRPELVAIFGGVVDPEKLHFPLNRAPATDARDWEAIERWALEVAALVDEEPALVS
jgi:menaquinone-dependent protoporphyrinogen oxidase